MMIETVKNWLENRTGLPSWMHRFFNEPIPASTGWRNTLGSLAGALLLIQLLTGFLLALYYVPHPEAAYESTAYVENQVPAGWLVRALHYWGASFIIVALFLHSARVFYTGTYRNPRELTWVVGILLFGTILALAFTGQYLPYNQMGYWAASVGIEIGSSAPIVGPYIGTLLRGGDVLGALTLSRFYALHIVLLPAILIALVLIHLYLLRRHGPARTPRDPSDDVVPFFPMQVLRDAIVITAGLGMLAGASVVLKTPYIAPIDLTDTTYVPRPEWYFLAHFELLKLAPPSLYQVATFWFPGAVITFLVALPWLDRSPTSAPSARKGIIGIGSVSLIIFLALTAYGFTTGGHEEASEADTLLADDSVDPAQARLAAGRAVYDEQMCATCHRINGDGETRGPDLSHVGIRLQEDYLREWLRDPEQFAPDTIMPSVMVEDEALLDALVAYLMSLKPEDSGD